ncbi:hypothetical protein [Pedobacter chitinilyticus]|uniref:hypothetical protein n=1 Tax=Pedobacter chitinilyticus TaxID=2233776 RepID=UPI0019699607|nr:hypothetical protein [Pedobacter chitinilyticus]
MKKLFFTALLAVCLSSVHAQIVSPNGDNIFYYNGAADVTFRYQPRGSGGRAFVHDDGNVLTLNYGGDFTGGVRLGSNFNVAPSGKMAIYNSLNTNDYTYVGQHNAQIRILNNLGTYSSRALEIALLDNGTGVIQANERNVGYNNLSLNPVEGYVGIGTLTPKEKLSVNGKIRAKEIKVELADWPDYVFEEGYQKLSLAEIEQFIKQNKHLPGVPTAKQVEQEGVELGEMNKVLLKKIEELTLHLIEKEKKLDQFNTDLKKRDEAIEALISRIEKLEKKN